MRISLSTFRGHPILSIFVVWMISLVPAPFLVHNFDAPPTPTERWTVVIPAALLMLATAIIVPTSLFRSWQASEPRFKTMYGAWCGFVSLVLVSLAGLMSYRCITEFFA